MILRGHWTEYLSCINIHGVSTASSNKLSYILSINLHLSIFRDFLLLFLKKSVNSVKRDSKPEQLTLISCGFVPTIVHHIIFEEVWKNIPSLTICNSVDTRGVCWLFGWGYFCGQSANKTQKKKAENLKFEIWFPEDQDVRMRQQTFTVSLKMLMSYFYESRHYFEDDREKFVTMKEDNFEFDLILLQLWNKIALSSRCPPSFFSFSL